MKKINFEVAAENFFSKDYKNLDLKYYEVTKSELSRELLDAETEISLYEGMESIISTGRPKKCPDRDGVLSMAEKLNKEKISFILALNGGLMFESLPFHLLGEEMKVLESLSNLSHKYGVANGVVIGHNDMLEYINSESLSLTKICSCKQMLNYLDIESYSEKFEKYDLVVPLNQHTVPEFLHNFPEHKDKMLVFLNLGCSNRELYRCYIHYLAYEFEKVDSILGDGVKYVDRFKGDRSTPNDVNGFLGSKVVQSFIDSNLCYPNCGSGRALLGRQDHLKSLMESGVHNFKIPRGYLLSPFKIQSFTDIAKEAMKNKEYA